MKTHTKAMMVSLFCLTFAGAAASQNASEGAQLTLTSKAAKSEYIIDGALWKCKETHCSAHFVADMPRLRSCQVIVRQMGAVQSFDYRGVSLSSDQIAQCNTRARA